jgi:type I restriction enzyme S subunit
LGAATVSGNFVFVSNQKADSLGANLARPGDLVFTQRGTLGQVSLVPNHPYDRYVVSQSQMKLTVDHKQADPLFYYHAFSGPDQQRLIQANTIQTGVPHINLGILRAIPVPQPPLREQRAIATALGDADALIESLEQLLVKKRQIKQGAMQELLTGKKRLPGFAGEWEIKRLGTLAKIQRGASPRPIENPIWFDDNSAVGWVRISDVTSSGMYLTATTQRLSLLGVQNSRPVSRGNLIMSICATVGRPIITDIDVCIHDGFVVFESLQVSKSYLYYLLKSIEADWSQHGQTGSQMNLNTGLITRTEVFLPSDLNEQNVIAAVLSDMDAEIATIETRLTKARQIKQGMMQELLTGRIRLVRPSAQVLSFPVKESASVASVSHNLQINEAVVIAVLSAKFGSEQFPLGRFRRTKFSYLLHRHVEHEAAGFMKKAAGPYNPRTRYGGAEKIALQNRYVRAFHTEKGEGFVAHENIAQAEGYFEKWYGAEALTWLEQFRYQKNDALELLTTVDMACEDLSRVGKVVTTSTVKQIIHDSPEWKAKLNRSVFSDDNIAATIQTCRQLFSR